MTSDLQRWRSLLGASTELWAGERGVRLGAERWSGFSGAKSADFNVTLCYGREVGGGLIAGVEEITTAGAPAVLMVAGAALAEVQTLVERGWACIGAVPFMVCELGEEANRTEALKVRRLRSSELQAVHKLIEEVFGLSPELALVAIPSRAPDRRGQSVWGGFDETGELVCCVATVRKEEIVVIWSMATASLGRRRRYGSALMRTVLADAAAGGAQASLLYAPSHAESFYRSLGYRELERWQVWSRPRWALGRA